MTEDRMLPFITKTWNPIAGGFCVEKDKIFACPFKCRYCWANILINKFKKGNLGKKYTGPYRLHEPAINPHFKPDDFVAVQFMSDIGAPGIPRAVLVDVFEAIKFYEGKGVRFLLLSKNPKFYHDWRYHISEDTVLGVTIETDLSISVDISLAPPIYDRLAWMLWIKENLPNDRFICIEPIMEFSKGFADRLIALEPWAVAVGYDNYDNKLKEPTLEDTEGFIHNFIEADVTVFQKTIRRAWDE